MKLALAVAGLCLLLGGVALGPAPRWFGQGTTTRASAWWFRTTSPAVVYAQPDATSNVLGCIEVGTMVESGGPLSDGWQAVMTERWMGYVWRTQLSEPWHAGALGGATVPLRRCV